MPNRRKGKIVYHKIRGRWRIKAKCKSVAAAKRMMRLLRGVAHGWKPTGKKSKRRRK